MGIPEFFSWLSNKYPCIVRPVSGNKKETLPEGCDNLYLDMNGVIHPCSHPEDKAQPQNEAEMMDNIYAYIDNIIDIVKPRKVLHMAIDGVAPRAKMNQQRARRFRAAQESRLKREQIAERRHLLRDMGRTLPIPPSAGFTFDSNCITPGTEFMARLAEGVAAYIQERLASHPAWASLLVIFSDASVPGEGEHKIMEFIRKQRASLSHNPNTVFLPAYIHTHTHTHIYIYIYI